VEVPDTQAQLRVLQDQPAHTPTHGTLNVSEYNPVKRFLRRAERTKSYLGISPASPFVNMYLGLYYLLVLSTLSLLMLQWPSFRR
jgi:hypothetical protein